MAKTAQKQKKPEETARLEVVTHEHTLHPDIPKMYGVTAKAVAVTKFFTVFALETHVLGDEDPGADLLTELREKQKIVAWSWSRPIVITGYHGQAFFDHLERQQQKEEQH